LDNTLCFLNSKHEFIQGGRWKLSRVLSYDHKDFDNESLFIDKDITEIWLKQKNIPALGNGKIEQVSVFGELEKGKSATKNTIWNVASLTKPIVWFTYLKIN